MNFVIAKLRNEKDAAFIAKYVRKFKGKARVINEEEVEKKWMLNMIEEAELEGGEVSEKEILKTLKQNGAEI